MGSESASSRAKTSRAFARRPPHGASPSTATGTACGSPWRHFAYGSRTSSPPTWATWGNIPEYAKLVTHFGAEGLRRRRRAVRWMIEQDLVTVPGRHDNEDQEREISIAGTLCGSRPAERIKQIRAAIAHEARKAPTIKTVEREGPKAGEIRSFTSENERMPTKRAILSELSAEELRAGVDHYELQVDDRRVKADLADALAKSRKARIDTILESLSRKRLKRLCQALNLDDSGRRKSDIVARLLGDRPSVQNEGTTAPRHANRGADEKGMKSKNESEGGTPPDGHRKIDPSRFIVRNESVSTQAHLALRAKIWEIANRLRGRIDPLNIAPSCSPWSSYAGSTASWSRPRMPC